MMTEPTTHILAKHLAKADGWDNIEQLVIGADVIDEIGPRGMRIYNPVYVMPAWHHYTPLAYSLLEQVPGLKLLLEIRA